MPTSFEELCAQALVGLSIASPAQIQAAPAAEAPNFDGDERYSPDFPPDFVRLSTNSLGRHSRTSHKSSLASLRKTSQIS